MTSIPVYPCTWVGVRLDTGQMIKLRSSNFDLKDRDDGPPIPVQTDRLRKSLFFNSLKKGDEILIMNHPTLKSKSGFPIAATVTQVPVFPSTWLSARILEDGSLIKVRTSQIDAPQKPFTSYSQGSSSSSGSNHADEDAAVPLEGEAAGFNDSAQPRDQVEAINTMVEEMVDHTAGVPLPPPTDMPEAGCIELPPMQSVNSANKASSRSGSKKKNIPIPATDELDVPQDGAGAEVQPQAQAQAEAQVDLEPRE